ncbi:MAG: NHL repeat-containing protein, partial [Elusimicrobia bacterium]
DTMFYFGWEGTAMSLRWQASNGSGSCLGNYQNLPNDIWHHFAVTWTSSQSRLYLNGALLASCGGVVVPNDPTPTCLSIAGGCGDGATTGKRDIDEVRVLNVALSSAQIALDAASPPPLTPYAAAVSTDGGATFAAVSSAAVSLTGNDGSTSTQTLTARGLALVESASLAAPLNVVRLTASDLTGKTTTLTFAVLVDTTPPLVAVSSPAAGSAFSAGTLVVHAAASDRLDPAPALTARLVQETDEGGNNLLDTLWVSTGVPIDVALLDAGSWRVFAQATDFAANTSSATSGLFRVERDVLPPRTTLLVEGPRVGDFPIFVTPRSSFSLSAFDDLLVLGDRAGVGVAASSYSIDSAALFTDYAGSFTIVQEGAHDLRYFSLDLAGNVEEVKLASVAVDASGPAVALGFQAPFRVLGGTSTVFVRGLGPLFLSATDYPSLAVGTTAVYLSVDGAAASGATWAFSLPEGLRQLAFWGVDLLGNQGSTVAASLKLDVTAPGVVAGVVVTALSSSAVSVAWTAPGDDGPAGDIYDAAVRLDFGPDPGNLAQSLVVSSGALAAGSALGRSFAGLSPGTTYYARAYTRDTAGHWSAASPLAVGRTFSVAVSADGVAGLTSPVPVEVTVVSTIAQAQAYTVAISSQGLFPSGTVFYELTDGLTFSTAAPAVLSFLFDPVLVDSGSVRIYTYDTTAGAWTSDSIFNQTLVLLDSGLYLISGEILHTSLYAPMVRDTAAPRTAFSVSGSSAVLEGRLFAAGGSLGVLTSEDRAPRGGARSGVAAVFYALGPAPESPYPGPFPLPEGERSVSFRAIDANGNLEDTNSARVFIDASAPRLSLDVDQSTFPLPGGFGTLSATVTLTVGMTDPDVDGARSGLAAASILIDGAPLDLTPQAGDAAASTRVFLTAGLHTVAWSAADRLGHASSRELKVAVGDTLAPVTTLTVGSPKAALPDGSVLVSAASELTLAAEDFAESGTPSGVAATYRRFAPGAFAPYAGPFTAPAPDGAKTLEFYSADRAGNIETPPKSRALVLDATPPGLAFAFPRPDEPGLCRLAQGPVAVRGSVGDAHPARWDLKEGAVLLASGTADADGLLGVWDAAGKNGSFNLNLSASDLVENAGSTTLSLQAGAPARTLALGGKRALNKPRGVAAGPNRIYVADTNADRVRVYDAAGAALAALGDKKGAAKLNKPAGLALDAAGNILVADANNKRVVKLSPAGAFLAEYGKGLLKRPMAVALSAGKIVVADAKAGRLFVFTEAGALHARVDLPSVPQSGRHDDDDEEDDDEGEEPRPMALAADSSGNVWVADAKGGRVLRYTADFTLAQTIPGFERPEGVAVSPSGSCLAVSDSKTSRIRTFDAALSAGLAAFGQHGEVKENRPLPPEFFLNKPAQLAFDAQGNLLVADRNNDLVQGFGLPGTPLVATLWTPGRSGGARLAAAAGGTG